MLSESNWREEKGGFVYVHVREKERWREKGSKTDRSKRSSRDGDEKGESKGK